MVGIPVVGVADVGESVVGELDVGFDVVIGADVVGAGDIVGGAVIAFWYISVQISISPLHINDDVFVVFTVTDEHDSIPLQLIWHIDVVSVQIIIEFWHSCW